MTEEKKKDNEEKALDKTMQASYQPGTPKMPSQMQNQIPEKTKKEMEKTREKLEKFKKTILKKYPFTLALGIIPPQAAEKFDEENELTEEEKKEKPMHLLMLIPEDNFKKIGKIKSDLIQESKDFKPKLWLNIITPIDLWNYCLDSKYDIAEAIGMCFPLYDQGILGALRVAQIHKSLCLRKFEKYVASYVIGGSLVRGEAKKTSDVDVVIVIDDTDVKRMPRLELKEKLRAIIYQYIAEASELAGVKNKLNVQVYILTEFWESVKDAHPVIFTFIRDGIPLYDKGTFLPWKLLLKMGKIKPSPEAIDIFMSMGDKTKDTVNRRLIDAMIDLYYAVLTPSQALLMLNGQAPPTHKETPEIFKKTFYEKEKLIEKKYVDTLTKLVKLFREYEHENLKTISGKEIDELMKESEDYLKRLKNLRKEIEKRTQQKTIQEIHENIFKILRGLFGKKTETQLIKQFEKQLVNKGKAEPRFLHVLNELLDVKKKYKGKKKPTSQEIETIRKNSVLLMNRLIEYGQRCELADLQKSKVTISYKNKHADLFLTNPVFLIQDGKLKKIENKKIQSASQEEFEKILVEQKNKPKKLSKENLSILKKELGDFEISF